jgi:hypothetical protein
MRSDVDSKNTKTPDVPIAAPMPPKAKSVKTREEANKIVAQLTNTNSAITYDPWGRIAKLVEPDSSVRQFVYSGDRLCEERDGTGAVTKQFFDWGETIGGTKYFTPEII